MSESAIAEIKKTKRTTRKWLKEEQGAKELPGGIKEWVWAEYGSLVADYDSSFSGVLRNFNYGSFRDLLLKRKAGGLFTHVLDLMGGNATFLRDLKTPKHAEDTPIPIDSSLCVTLVDERSQARKDLEKKLEIDILDGDITSNNTWRRVDKWQQKNGALQFDLIVCRGVDGVDESIIPKALYPYMFGKIWERLSDNSGLFVTQLPCGVDKEVVIKPLIMIPKLEYYFQAPPSEEWTRYPNKFPALGVQKKK